MGESETGRQCLGSCCSAATQPGGCGWVSHKTAKLVLSFLARTSSLVPSCARIWELLHSRGSYSSIIYPFLPFLFQFPLDWGLQEALSFTGWVPSDRLGQEGRVAGARRRMWKAGSASAGVIPNRVLGEGAQHFRKGNDSHK